MRQGKVQSCLSELQLQTLGENAEAKLISNTITRQNRFSTQYLSTYIYITLGRGFYLTLH